MEAVVVVAAAAAPVSIGAARRLLNTHVQPSSVCTEHTDAPLDAPHTDAPLDAPHTDAPHTDAPHTDAPHTDAQHIDTPPEKEEDTTKQPLAQSLGPKPQTQTQQTHAEGTEGAEGTVAQTQRQQSVLHISGMRCVNLIDTGRRGFIGLYIISC